MAHPAIVCLERVGAPQLERYVRCVALVGGQAGLGLDAAGSIVWMQPHACAFMLCVSRDDQLIVVRADSAPELTVHRAGRFRVAPPGKPVVLLGDDAIEVAGVCYRIHLHGVAREVQAPRVVRRWAAVAAVAATLAAGAGAGCGRAGSSGASQDAGTMQDAELEGGLSDASLDRGEGEGGASDAADAWPDAEADAEAGAEAAARIKPHATPGAGQRPPVRKKHPIEVRDFPPFSD